MRLFAGHLIALLFTAASSQATASFSYPVVDTGQSRCYNDRAEIPCPAPGQPYSGQDAHHAGAAPQYRDNGDGTITDQVTGLMWQKAFQRARFADAALLAGQARTGGHSDWRVPTVKELYSLIDFSGSTGSAPPDRARVPQDARPYLDTGMFEFEYPAAGRYIDAQYISSTVYRGLTMGHNRTFFGVNFADGRIKGYPQDGGPGKRTWYLRLVRGNPNYGRNDFVADEGRGTVTDRATGLTWMQADSGDPALRAAVAGTDRRNGALDWREALAFCEGLTWGGRSDWRLPNAKELHTIVDYRRSPGSTQSPAIDPLFRTTAIQDSAGQPDWPYFWSSTTHLDGPVQGDFAIYFAFGEAKGNMPPMGLRGGASRWEPDGARTGPRKPFGFAPRGPLTLMDVHGAGAQRSSPKSGDESRLPVGAGPQGDVLRIYNYARCVAGE